MNIKTRLSVQFSLIVTGILVFFSLLVYYISYTSQLTKFRESLLERAQNTAILLIDVTEIDSLLLKKIHQSTISLQKEEIAVIDSALSLIYGYEIDYLTSGVLEEYSGGREERYFSISGKDGVCSRHNFNGREYSVFVMAFDSSRLENLAGLRRILLWSTLFSILLSVLFSYFFSKRAIKPISDIIFSVKEINSLKLSHRLDEGNRKDEIAQLAITFNEMLTNLEISFRNQQDFFSNASHELRTPLTVMIGESDYLLSHERSTEEYVRHIGGLVEDLRKLNTLLNSLLELAQVNVDRNFPFSDVRIDEILFNAIQHVRIKYPDRKLIPKIIYPENSSDLIVSGHAGLLEIVFRNLLENACKFSDEDVNIDFTIDEKVIGITVSDKGIGIPVDEIESVFEPFRRASNARYIGGFGVGLSLVTSILELHDAELHTRSTVGEGTQFEILFKKSIR